MKEVRIKLDNLFEKTGQMDKYQFIITIFFTIQFACSQFFNLGLPFLEAPPLVFVEGSDESIPLTMEMCEGDKDSYSIDKSINVSSIIEDFNIYCDRNKIYLIGLFYYSGMIIGSFMIYLFADKIGRRAALIIFIPIHILCLCLFHLARPELFDGALIFLYCNLFLLGICTYAINITMMVYMSEIVKQIDIPKFITVIVTGMLLSEVLSTILFGFSSIDWRYVLMIIGGINFLLYIAIFKYMIGSPIFALNNSQYKNFVQFLIEIGEKNGKLLEKEDFEFLFPFIPSNSRREIRHYLRDKFSRPSSLDNRDSSVSDTESKDSILSFGEENKNAMKDEYVLDSEKNLDEPVRSLFGKLKMKDYSPLDLLRFKSQIINFLILSFLWAVYNIIKTGTNLLTREFLEFRENYYWSLVMCFLEFVCFLCIFILFLCIKTGFLKLLIFIELISFFLLLLILFVKPEVNRTSYIILNLLVKVTWTSIYLLLIVIISLIYPTMLRTKGMGGNVALGSFGLIITLFLVESQNLIDSTYYFIVFNFFSLVLSNGLPKRIATLLNDLPEEKKKEQAEEENNETELNNSLKNSELDINGGLIPSN